MTPENVYEGRGKERSKDFRGNGRGERKNSYSSSGNDRDNKRGSINDRPKRDRVNSGKDNNRYHSYGFSKDKDEDEERRPFHSKPRRTEKNDELAKIKEQQSDKLLIMKKLEKEQKAMKKKSEEKKKSQRPVQKQKRSNNINYTRQYEDGMFEDYEDWYDNF